MQGAVGKATKTFQIKCKTPGIPSAATTGGGVKLSWKKTDGAAKYRIFKKTGKGKWTKLADTNKLTYTDKKVKTGTTYAYTIRCISADGKKYTSDYNKAGRVIVYLKPVVLSKVTTPKANQIKVTWKKDTTAAGYQIQYSLNKKFAKGNKTVTVKGAKTAARVIKKLKSKKIYYVRIRSYKKVGKTTYYSAWSTVKNIKVK